VSTNYTERDTERAQAEERNSEGLPTQQLSGSFEPTFDLPGNQSSAGVLVNNPPRNNNPIALGLIGVGLFVLISQLFGERLKLEGGMILFTIASFFLFFSFWKRIYGLLIPGSILAGLSLGVTFADLTNGVSVLWGLALGFLSILLIGRSLFNVHSNWPIYPAMPLFGVGLIAAMTALPSFLGAGLIWIPFGLIAAGLFLGWGRQR
jgi:hypothetical protein